jgi:hypothetical protein
MVCGIIFGRLKSPTRTGRVYLTQHLFLAAEETADKRDVACATSALLLLLVVATEQTTKAKTAEQLVDTKSTQETVDQAAKTKTVEELADKVENTSQQQTNSGDDLEQRLGEKRPERVELLLGVGHVGDLLLRVVNGSDNRRGELLQAVGKLVLLRSGLTSLLTALSLSSDAAVGVETTERAVALVQHAATLLDERLDVIDQLFLVELVARCAVGFLDVLETCQCGTCKSVVEYHIPR